MQTGFKRLEGDDNFIYLSSEPLSKNAIKIDLSKTDLRRVAYTGQSEGYMIHKGNIPSEAILESAPLTRQIANVKKNIEPLKDKYNHPQYSVEFTDKIFSAKEGDIVGTLGNLLVGEQTRNFFKEIIDYPIVVLERMVQDGKEIQRDDVTFKGGSGKIAGQRAIFVSGDKSHQDVINTIIHEAAHEMRALRGRLKKTDMANVGFEDYKHLKDEQLVEKIISHVKTLDKPDQPYAGGKAPTGITSQTSPQETARIKKELIKLNAAISGNKVTLYRGGNVSETKLRKLRYNDFLSTVKEGNDAVGNAGASSYGKNIVTIKVPIKDIKITNGEIQYVGTSSSISGRGKYPQKFYKDYNDFYGSNFTSEEIDNQRNVRVVVSQQLEGGSEEFDLLMEKHTSLNTDPRVQPQEEKTFKV